MPENKKDMDVSINRNQDYLMSLVNELRNYRTETEWVEFKHNNSKPDEIGEQISALANSAALLEKTYAYLIWGIDDTAHDIIGTAFSLSKTKVGNEELENWLLKLIEPKIHFQFFEIVMNNCPLVILEIPKAFRHPVRFKSEEYVKIGSYTKKLKDFPEKERQLWKIFDETPFESHIAASDLSSDEILKLFDYPAYFDLLNRALPESRNHIFESLEMDGMISCSQTKKWNILNLGAILFAKKITDFKSIRRKAVRVILYADNSRNAAIKEQECIKGYANGFEELVAVINNFLPRNEIIGQAFRKNVVMYPELAIRELVANSLIHQDFFITGAGPLIEIFKDRIEITNPGKPLIDTIRFLDSPPRSRNEALASFMRRIGVCEERGSGVDKVVQQTEIYQLPAPVFETVEENTRAMLFAYQPLNMMDKNDRIRACYLHACLKYVTRPYMTNSSLRERFGIESKNSALASRIIKDTIAARLIHLYDVEATRKNARYVPYWAR